MYDAFFLVIMMVFLFWGDSGGVELCGQFKRGGGVEDDIFVVFVYFYFVNGVSKYIYYVY